MGWRCHSLDYGATLSLSQVASNLWLKRTEFIFLEKIAFEDKNANTTNKGIVIICMILTEYRS